MNEKTDRPFSFLPGQKPEVRCSAGRADKTLRGFWSALPSLREHTQLPTSADKTTFVRLSDKLEMNA